jgi:hypothetical protein
MNAAIDVRDEYDRLRAFYDATGALLDHPDDVLFRTDETVSDWSPAEHLYHIGLANGRSLKAALLMAQGALPLQEHGEPNEAGRTVLNEGHFETGRYEAPDNVQPPASITRDDVQEALSRSRAKLDDLADHLAVLSTVAGRLAHPRLGPLNGPQWLRFVRVHSEHHHAIIRDILPPDVPPAE